MPRARRSRFGNRVEIVLVGLARIDLLADAFEPGGERQRRGEIRIDRAVGVARFTAAAAHRHPHRIGAVVRAVGIEHRRPGEIAHGALPHQALVAVDGRREGGTQRAAVLQDAADEMITESRVKPRPRGSSFGSQREQIVAAGEIVERHVEMRAAAGLVGEGLGHHGRQQAFFLGVVLGHVAEKDQAVAHGQRVGVFEIELVLPVGVLVVEGIEVPAEIVDAGRDLVEPAEIVEEAAAGRSKAWSACRRDWAPTACRRRSAAARKSRTRCRD